MHTTTSKDGTTIAYEKLGSGPPVVLVDGAFCRRAFGPMPTLAPLLAKHFTVLHYDRRGRGDSGDTQPYASDRELEDLVAVVQAAGGEPFLYGISSGAALALRGVASGIKVKKLVVYEPPFALDGTHTPSPPDYREQIAGSMERGDRDAAVKLFMKAVGAPAFAIFMMRLMPNVWPKLRAVAHTLAYDFALLGDTQSGGPLPGELREKLASIQVPTLAMAGGKSPNWMHHASKTVASTVQHGEFRVIPGQDHNLGAKALLPVLLEYFTQAKAAA
jgi:pimeloyl-ACP methyl ester carboxylesterase